MDYINKLRSLYSASNRKSDTTPRQRVSKKVHLLICRNKRYFIIDQQIARHFCNTVEVFQTPLSFYIIQIINPFLNLRISANHDKEQGLQPILKSCYSLMFLQCRISFAEMQKSQIFPIILGSVTFTKHLIIFYMQYNIILPFSRFPFLIIIF